MSEEKKIRSVQLYPPVEKKWAEFEAMMTDAGKKANFSWHVNLLFAHRFGIPEFHIEKYKREQKPDDS